MINPGTDLQKPGRRRFLAGLAGFMSTPLVACTDSPKVASLAATRPLSGPETLASVRLFADAGPDEWAAHLVLPTSASGLTVLAISGGGEDGAFGAGALAGWTASGTRPDFDMVTGVSTGALIAPFAFLGQDHDDALRRIFTEHDADDLMKLRPLQALFGEALYDTAPLADLIETFTPPALLQTIAARHASGARLFVVTSELDTARASIWNMGLIAQSGDYDLFRAILRASAALPGLFPPVEIGCVRDGISTSETHMDGGVHMQFLAIPSFAFAPIAQPLPDGHLYLLINNTLAPAPVTTARTALGIFQQAITTIGRASAASAVDATRVVAHNHGLDLSVASIDPLSGIVYDPDERFSSNYMNALFRHGYERAAHETLWQSI